MTDKKKCDVVDCVDGWIACEGDEGTPSRRPCRGCTAGCHETIDALEHVLRSVAAYLGAGGFNCESVDPSEFNEKIRWGIGELENESMALREIIDNVRRKCAMSQIH